MRPQDRAIARRQLDKRLNPLRDSESLMRPPRGWIKAIREALGMTTVQLGKRIGVSQPRVVQIEKAETNGTITLDSIQRAARALDCRLVYALLPKTSLELLVIERATKLAESRMKSTSHSMALEEQSVDEDEEQEQLLELIKQLVDQSGSALWEDE